MDFFVDLFTFRNDTHFNYFLVTFVFSSMMIGMTLYGFYRRDRGIGISGAILCVCFGMVFINAAHIAYELVYIEKITDYSMWSPDCVWYNGLLGLSFLIVPVIVSINVVRKRSFS